VANVVEGAVAAAERGAGGEASFLTDGEQFREFVTKLLAAQVDAGTKQLPRWTRSTAAVTGWMKHPPITRTEVALIAHQVTVVDAKARRELGYKGAVTREAGLAAIRG
jgi:hypothetical protein